MLLIVLLWITTFSLQVEILEFNNTVQQKQNVTSADPVFRHMEIKDKKYVSAHIWFGQSHV